MFPQKIVLVRHGESKGNVNPRCYVDMHDSEIPLSPDGVEQALQCGLNLKEILDDRVPIHTYVSPYTRTRQTLSNIQETLGRDMRVCYDARLREQHWGTFETTEESRYCLNGYLENPLHFKFPRNGESGLEVLDRINSFIETLHRHFNNSGSRSYNVLLVTHGMTMRLFLNAWFQKDPEHAKTQRFAYNCEPIVLELDRYYDFYTQTPDLTHRKHKETE